MKELENILRNKSKIELQVISKNIGITGWSGLSKEKLINKLISDRSAGKKLNIELGLKKSILNNPWFQGIIFFLMATLLTIYFSSLGASKNDFQNLNDRIDKNEQYLNRINNLEEMNKKFLGNIMSGGYVIFGIEDGKVMTQEILSGNQKLPKFNSRIGYFYDEKRIKLELDYSEFDFHGYSLSTTTHSKYLPLEEGKIMLANLVQMNPCHLFVLLDSDREQPVFALGIGDCKFGEDPWSNN